ncbi:MAG: putative serine protease PepD [Solirubrobacteraceae bacterium]|nr:putative serine protease PepD [Solirubrobacteraceae bacterium]
MTPSLLTPPPDPPPLWADDHRLPPEDAPPPRRRRGNRRLAVLLVTSALLGGGASTGILAAAGLLGRGSSTTTTVLQSTASDGSSATGLNPRALYASAASGVVDITAQSQSASSQSPFGGPSQQSTATGTGFVADAQGHIVTAAHVVDGASAVTVKLADGTTRKATVTGKDDATDIAVIKIDPSGLTLHPLALGSSASLGVGAPVAAIGDPFGYARSLSTGIVSGVDRTIQAPNGFTVAHAIQTDAAINPGNSGGPVLDAQGKVVGIVDQIATASGADQSSGVGFAVPIDIVRSALKTLEAGGKVAHAYMGIATSDSSTATAGATVSQVTSGGPAASAGLRAGDVITAFAGTAVNDSSGLVAAIAAHQPGDGVKLTVRRGSSTVHATVTLGTQPTQSSNTAG